MNKETASPLWMTAFIEALPGDVKAIIRDDYMKIDVRYVDRSTLLDMTRRDINQLALIGPSLDRLEQREGWHRRAMAIWSYGTWESATATDDNERIRGLMRLRRHMQTILSLVFFPLLANTGYRSSIVGIDTNRRQDYAKYLSGHTINLPHLWSTLLSGDVDTALRAWREDPQALRSVYRGETLAHIAAIHDDINLLQKLIGIDQSVVNWYNSNGQTPLHLAAQFGFLDVVQLLLQTPGADAVSLDNRSYSPLRYALLQYCFTASFSAYLRVDLLQRREVILELQKVTPVVEPIDHWTTVVGLFINLARYLFRSFSSSVCCFIFWSRVAGVSWRLLNTMSWFEAIILLPGALYVFGRQSLNCHADPSSILSTSALEMLTHLGVVDDMGTLFFFVSCVETKRLYVEAHYLTQDLTRQWKARNKARVLPPIRQSVPLEFWPLIEEIICDAWKQLTEAARVPAQE